MGGFLASKSKQNINKVELSTLERLVLKETQASTQSAIFRGPHKSKNKPLAQHAAALAADLTKNGREKTWRERC